MPGNYWITLIHCRNSSNNIEKYNDNNKNNRNKLITRSLKSRSRLMQSMMPIRTSVKVHVIVVYTVLLVRNRSMTASAVVLIANKCIKCDSMISFQRLLTINRHVLITLLHWPRYLWPLWLKAAIGRKLKTGSRLVCRSFSSDHSARPDSTQLN